MKKYLWMAPALMFLGPINAGAQTPLPQDPAASRLTQALMDALSACDKRGESQFDVGYCAGTSFGILEAYLISAGRCHETRSDADCKEASRLRTYATDLLEKRANR